MTHVTFASSLTLAMIAATTTARAEGFVFPSDAGPGKVVVAPDADDQERRAAQALAYYLERMTEVAPEIVEEHDALPTAGNFFVGATQRGRDVLGALDDLPNDGYAMRTHDGGLFVAGPMPIGTLNGVVGLLQDDLNVVWGMPRPLWHHVPRRARIELPEIDRREQPRFAFRILSGVPGGDVMGETPLSYQEALRATDRTHRPRFAFGHNLDKIIPEAKYAESNPEYFAYVESAGKRYVGTADNPTLANPCFTNPDVFRITVEAVRAAFDADPDREAFSLCTNDNVLYCECEGCAALDAPRREWRGFRDYSDSYFDFMKRVGEEIEKSHPGRYITAYVYWGAIMPPRRIERLPDNVHVALTQDVPQHMAPKYKEENMWLLAEWRKRVSTLSVYIYWNLGWLTPRHFPTIAGEYLQTIAEHDVFGIYCETYPYWALQGPMMYTSFRQMWNPDLDTEALTDEFMTTFFGDQAHRVAACYKMFEEYWNQPREGLWFEGFQNYEQERAIGNPRLLEQAVALLYQARLDTKDELVAQRIDWLLEWSRLAVLLVRNFRDIDHWSDPETRPNPLRDEYAREQARTMVQRDREMLWLAEALFRDDDLHRSRYFSGHRIWDKLREGAQATQDALVMAVQQASLHQVADSDAAPSWDALDDWLDDLRLGIDLTPGNRSQGLLVTDAADMLGHSYRAARATPQIDGDLADWAGRDFRPLAFRDSEWGRVPIQAEAALAWDQDHLYVAVRVQDEVHVQTKTDAGIWWEDSIQIAIDPFRSSLGENPRNQYSEEDQEYGFALLGDTAVGWRYTGGPPTPVTDAPMAIVHADGVTSYEIAMPWRLITPDGSVPPAFMGVNVAVNASDGGPRSAQSWTDGIIASKNPRPFLNVWLERAE